MNARKTANIAEPILGDKLYQERARKTFPLLVRQAEAGQTIFYSDLAQELEMPNPRNLNYVLGSIGQTVERISKAWKEPIPPIQCLVINKNTGLPGEGIGWFLIKKEDFSKLPRLKQREIVSGEMARVRAYPKWAAVLAAAGLSPTKADFAKLNAAAAHEGIGGGESEQHRRFKEFVAANPSVIDLPSGAGHGSMEVALPSGDSLDVAFQTSSEWVAAEVKSAISNETDLVRGLYQCVKYQAVMQAVEASESRERSARAVLVLENKLPERLIPLRNILGITVYDDVRM